MGDYLSTHLGLVQKMCNTERTYRFTMFWTSKTKTHKITNNKLILDGPGQVANTPHINLHRLSEGDVHPDARVWW